MPSAKPNEPCALRSVVPRVGRKGYAAATRWRIVMERDLGVGMAIVTAAIVGFGLMLVTAGPDWVLDLPVVSVAVLVVMVTVAYFIVVYRRRLII